MKEGFQVILVDSKGSQIFPRRAVVLPMYSIVSLCFASGRDFLRDAIAFSLSFAPLVQTHRIEICTSRGEHRKIVAVPGGVDIGHVIGMRDAISAPYESTIPGCLFTKLRCQHSPERLDAVHDELSDSLQATLTPLAANDSVRLDFVGQVMMVLSSTGDEVPILREHDPLRQKFWLPVTVRGHCLPQSATFVTSLTFCTFAFELEHTLGECSSVGHRTPQDNALCFERAARWGSRILDSALRTGMPLVEWSQQDEGRTNPIGPLSESLRVSLGKVSGPAL